MQQIFKKIIFTFALSIILLPISSYASISHSNQNPNNISLPAITIITDTPVIGGTAGGGGATVGTNGPALGGTAGGGAAPGINNSTPKNLIILGYDFGYPPAKVTFLSIIGFVLYLGRNLIGIAAFVAIIYMMVGGLTIIWAAGNEDQYRKGRSTLTFAIIGFIVAVSAFVIVNSFLNYVIGVNLGELPTAPE